MQKTTKQQRQAIYRLTGYNKQYKAELVYQVTQDRQKISTHDLNFNQANTIIVALGGQAYHRDVFWAFFDPHSKQHKYILSLVQQAGHKKTSVNYGYVADLDWLDKFLHRDSPVKKPLKSMTPDETSKIIFALEEIVKWKNGQKS